MADTLRPIPISSLPEAETLEVNDQIIAYREDNGKAYRATVGSMGEAAEGNISDAFSTTKSYSAGDYVIYNDVLYKFTADKDIGAWDDSVVEQTTVGSEISDLYYHSGDIIRYDESPPGLAGTLQTGGNVIATYLWVSKPIASDVTEVEIEPIQIVSLMTISGRVVSTQTDFTDYTFTAEVISSDVIRILITKNGGYGVTNFTPVLLQIYMNIIFK